MFLVLILAFSQIDLKAETASTQLPQTEFNFEVSSSVRQYSTIKGLMLNIGESELLSKISKIVKFDLEFTDQLEIELKKVEKELEPVVLSKLFDKGTSIFIYVKDLGKTDKKNEHSFQVSLKEPSSNKVLFDKNFVCSETNLVYQSHQISDDLLPALTSEKGPILSTLAYCKQVSPKCKVVCIADYACKKEKIVVGKQSINVAPCWHSQAPILYYSQLTKHNGKLMSVDLKTKKHSVVCAYDGLNMQPTFSKDGQKAVMCLSGGGNSELYLYDQLICQKLGRRAFKQLTKNNGNNVCPSMMDNGNVIFCSDFESPWPQIYHLDVKNNITTRLTNGHGYCAAPSYCAKNNSIVYSRLMNNTFQLFKINLNESKKHEQQITFNHGNKHEPSWSECGNYIAFTQEVPVAKRGKAVPQVAIINCRSGKVRILTDGLEAKSFPAWTNAPVYQI